MATNWQKIAGERLKRVKLLKQRVAQEKADIERKARGAIQTAVHASCLASLGDERVKRMIDYAVEKLVRDLHLNPED